VKNPEQEKKKWNGASTADVPPTHASDKDRKHLQWERERIKTRPSKADGGNKKGSNSNDCKGGEGNLFCQGGVSGLHLSLGRKEPQKGHLAGAQPNGGKRVSKPVS